jgi:DNA-binding CsgD family transcriptional regulator
LRAIPRDACCASREDLEVIVDARMLGRDRELAMVADLVARTNEGGGALLVHGDPGIGKSALLRRAMEAAQDAGLRVLRTTGVRTEAHLPFAGLHLLLRPILGGLSSLPAPQRLALGAAFGLVEGGSSDAFLVGLATLTLLADAAADAGILVVIDDAHWLDRPSAEALAFVARRLGSDPLSMLVGLRDGEESPIQAAGIDQIELAPLDDVDAREVVARLAPDLAPAVRDRLVREAAGNPLALAELAATIRDDATTGDALPDVLPLSARLERTFAAQTDDLPEATQWLMLIAALDDRDASSEILAAASVPSSALEPAVGARLVEVDEASLRFRHPLVRSAIQQRATVEERQRAHLALAGVVGDVDRAAWHRAAATLIPDESVASLLDRAADRAMRRGAFVVAVSALERAAALSTDGRSRGTRLLRAAEVANELGRMDAIGQLLADAEPIDVPALEDRRQAWITALSLTGPRLPREADNLRSVVAAARRLGDDGLADLGLTLLQFASARSWWAEPGVEIRLEIADAAIALAPTPDDARVLFMRAIAPEGHIDYVLEQLSERQRSPEPMSGSDGRRYATTALWVGALDLAVDYFTASIADLRETGRLGLLARSLIIRAFSSVHIGNLATVASDLDEGLRLGLETRQPFYVTTAHAAQAIYLAFRGDIAGAEARIRDAELVQLNAPAGASVAETRHARGLIDIAAGRYDDAYEELRHLYDPRHPSYHSTVAGWAISDFADAASKTGHVPEGDEVVRFLEADTVRMKMPWWRIGVAYARLVLAGAAAGNSWADVDAAFASARAMDLDRWPLARGRLSLAYGTCLRRRRRPAESRAELRAARDLFDAIGVRYLADRAQLELGASGEATRHRGIDVLDELTPQELQIARLAAEGLSNREIGTRLYLSHRTVGSHLYRVFPKLGITSRAQLHSVLR